MLALPLLLGLALSGGTSAAAWAIAPAFLLAFLAHEALVPALQRLRSGKPAPVGYLRRRGVWGAGFAAAAIAAFGAAVSLAAPADRPSLAAVAAPAALSAAVYGAAAAMGEGRALWSELVGMAGMSLAAPMMAAAGGTPPWGRPMGAAAMAFAYCASSVTYVRSYERLATAPGRAAAACLGVHALLLAAIAALTASGTVPPLGLAAFVPVAARAAWGLARPPRNLKGVGLQELWVASAFAAVSVSSLLPW